MFALHDMKLEASGEPSPPRGADDDDDDRRMMYEGAMVLHHLDLGWDLELAIEALEKANYEVKDLDDSFRHTLMEVFSEGTPNAELAACYLDWDEKRADDALDAIRHTLLTICDS